MLDVRVVVDERAARTELRRQIAGLEAQLSAAVSQLLNDQALSDELRQNAKGLKSRYSVDAMVEEYVRILGQVI